jgi:hypothetical protein
MYMTTRAQKDTSRGSLPEIVRNDQGLYEGDLVGYFRVIFFNAKNLNHAYHNFRHMFHVTWLCYQACDFYRKILSPREMRNLLIAAMFHDFDHADGAVGDEHNIAVAVSGLTTYVLPEDKKHLEEIISLIRATEYPYAVPSEELPLLAQIIRDADMGQGFSDAWIQQIVFGLAAEQGKRPIEILRSEEEFCRNVRFHTEWGRSMFSREKIDEKAAEAKELLGILEEADGNH